MKVLTPDQLTAFFQKAGKSGVYERCYMDLDNRPAAGELLGLKWTGIDFQRKTLRIQRCIARQNGGNVKTVSGMMGPAPDSRWTPTPTSPKTPRFRR